MKFRDLVRETTTVEGLFPLAAVGGATAGFRTFADALADGDTFYYSIIGVDNPAESEVGRGTWHETDNEFTRSPLGGAALTDFSPGQKTAAIVVAAEWFQAAPLNLKSDFGAVGDNVADDTIPLANAIVAASAAGGGTIIIPAGDYKITDEITIPGFVYLQGEGTGVSQLVQHDLTKNLLKFNMGYAQGGGLSKLTLKSNVAEWARGSSGIALNVIRANDNFVCSEFEVLSFDKCVRVEASYQPHFDRFRLLYFADYGINLAPVSGLGETAGTRWTHGKISCNGMAQADCENSVGILIEQGSGEFFDIIDTTITGRGIVIAPPVGSWARFLKFKSVMADSSFYEGWDVDATNAAVLNVRMVDCWASTSGGGANRPAGSVRGAGLRTRGANLNDLTWLGGEIRDNDAHGWDHQAGTNCNLIGATVSRNSRRVGFDNIYYGVNIAAGVSGWSIIGCTIGNVSQGVFAVTQLHGIVINNGASTDFSIIGNDLRSPGAGGTGLSNGASGTGIILGNKPTALNVIGAAEQAALNLKANLTANSFSATQTVLGAVSFSSFANPAPINGDIWNAAGVMKYREGGTTKNLTQEPPIAAGTTTQYWRGDKSWQTLDKTAVGLGNVTNVAQAAAGAITGSGLTMNTARILYRKTASPGAVEEQTIATLKADLALTKADVGLSNVDNTADTAKPVSTAQQAALNLKANLAGGNSWTGTQTFTGVVNHASTANGAPVNGDIWFDGTRLKKREGGVTSDLDTFSAGGGLANPQTGTDLIRVENSGSAAPAGAAGPGLELIGNSAGSAILQGYNRTANSFIPLFLNAGSLAYQIGSVTVGYQDAVDSIIFNNFKLGNLPAPAAVQADFMGFAPQRIAASGGRVLPRFRSEDGINITPQASFARNTITGQQAMGNASANSTMYGAPVLTAVGTATTRNVSTGSRRDRARRAGYVTTSAAAGLACGYYNPATVTQWTVGGAAGAGFLFTARFSVSDASLVAGAHAFIGMRNSTAAPSVTAAPNTLTNVIGVAQINGSANWYIVYGGSAAQTAIDTGIPVNNTNLLELILYPRPDDATKVAWRFEDISSGAVASGVLTGVAGTALPANTTLLGPTIWRSNNATAVAAAIDIVSWFVESDI